LPAGAGQTLDFGNLPEATSTPLSFVNRNGTRLHRTVPDIAKIPIATVTDAEWNDFCDHGASPSDEKAP
jgi:hypothetical protein